MNTAQQPLRPIHLLTYNLLLLSFLLPMAPKASIGATGDMTFQAAQHSLDIDFAFDAPVDPAKKVVGYKLYKEGVKVCETKDPSLTRMKCAVMTEDGTFKFTLTASYNDNTESLPSPAFPFVISSKHSVKFAWNAASGAENQGGFRIYDNGVLLSETKDSAARQMTYSSEFSTANHTYTIAAVDANGTEKLLTGALTSSEVNPPAAVISSSTAAGNAPLAVKFDGSSSTAVKPPLVKYSWQFGDGSKATGQTASHNYTAAGTYTAQLTVEDSQGLTDTVTTPVVVGQSAAGEKPAAVAATDKTEENASSTAGTALPMEVGEVSLDQQWVKVMFEGKYAEPVVIAGSPTTVNEAEPATVRVRNVDKQGFEIRLQEWDYQNGTHAPETVNYLVMEKGVHTLGNGAKIEAGTFTGGNSFQQIPLQQSYNLNPVVLCQVATVKKAAAVTGRIQNVTPNSFEYKLQEMESTATAHEPETVSYIAWEPGKGEAAGLLYETVVMAKGVGQNWSDLAFGTKFTNQPAFIAGMQTRKEDDTATVRSRKVSTSAAQLKIEEEQSKDKEVMHGNETVGYLVIGAGAPVQP